MHSQSLERIEDFRKSVRTFRKIWRSILVRASWATAKGRDVALYVTVTLETALPNALPKPRHNPTVKGFSAVWEPRPSADIDALLDDLKRDVVRVAGRELHIGFFEAEGAWITDRHTYQSGFYKRSENYYSGCQAPGATLWMNGAKIEAVTNKELQLSQLTTRWNALPRPFKDGKDVVSHFFDMSQYGDGGESAFVGVRASIPIRLLDSARYDGSTFSYSVTAPPTADIRKLTIGEVITRTGKQPIRRSIRPEAGELHPKPQPLLFTRKMPALSIEKIYLVLRYQGQPLDEWRGDNPSPDRPNAAIALHRVFDPGLGVLEDYLTGTDKQDHAFEFGVSWLMALCGLPPLVYGSAKRLQGEIDLCVYAEAHKTVVGLECTIDQPNNKEKMAKLFHRCRLIHKALPGFRVIPALASRLALDSVPPADVAGASKNNVALLTREKLQNLLEMAKSKAPASEVLRYISGCIPSTRLPGGILGQTATGFDWMDSP